MQPLRQSWQHGIFIIIVQLTPTSRNLYGLLFALLCARLVIRRQQLAQAREELV